MSWDNIALLFFILIAYSLCETKRDKESDESFEATNEWKVIKEGQKVPAGLHYRINLATGKKEAKLNDASESDTSKAFTLVNAEGNNKAEDEDKKPNKNNILKKFRSLDEIKNDLSNIKISTKTDAEILDSLFKKYEEENKKHPKSNEVMSILRDLIYLGHQIDNGNEFVKMDGFNKIIYKQLNSTNVVLKQEALRLFSTLAQNNPQVKVHILETGGVTILLRLLYHSENQQIYSNVVTALSCTLRTFPYAQNKFVDSGGLTIFLSLFKSDSIKLKLKMATLLTDLAMERQTDVENFRNHEFIDIEERLYDLGWCNYLNNLLDELVQAYLYDYDSVDKCLSSMKTFITKCGQKYKKDALIQLYNSYEELIKEDDIEDYFRNIIEVIELLIKESGDGTISNKEEL